MKRISLLMAVFMLACLCGCGDSQSVSRPPVSSDVQPDNPTPTPSDITDVQLVAFLRNDGDASSTSQTPSAAARHEAKLAYASIRVNPITTDPGAINIYVRSFGMRDGWVPLDERKITSTPGPYTSAHLSFNDKDLVLTKLVDGYTQVFSGVVPESGEMSAAPLQLTGTPEHHWAPHISADGSKVLFTKYDAISNGDVICVIDNMAGAVESCMDLSATTPVLSGANLWHASWLGPDAVVFEAWGGQLSSDSLFSIHTDGSGLTQITSNAGTENYDESPSANDAGTFIAYDTWNNSSQSYEVYELDLQTSQKYRLDEGWNSWDPLYSFTPVWVAQTDTLRLYVMSFSPIPITSYTYPSYFDNSFVN